MQINLYKEQILQCVAFQRKTTNSDSGAHFFAPRVSRPVTPLWLNCSWAPWWASLNKHLCPPRWTESSPETLSPSGHRLDWRGRWNRQSIKSFNGLQYLLHVKTIVRHTEWPTLWLHVAQLQQLLTWPAWKYHAGLRRRLCGRQWHFSFYSSGWHHWPGRKGWVCEETQLLAETKHM